MTTTRSLNTTNDDSNTDPPGWSTWGNFGDGQWRAGRNVSEDKPWTQEGLFASKDRAETRRLAWAQYRKTL